jgi:hypothetical protein
LLGALVGRIADDNVVLALAHQAHEAHAGRELFAAQAQAQVGAAGVVAQERFESIEHRGLGALGGDALASTRLVTREQVALVGLGRHCFRQLSRCTRRSPRRSRRRP